MLRRAGMIACLMFCSVSVVYGAQASADALKYAFPVQPSDRASYGPGHHTYPATDIFAPEGSRFVAPARGVVDEVSRQDKWDPKLDRGETRGGLFVSVVGDDGIRYYGSHLRSVAGGIDPGVRVVAGQLLGFVGRSGDARRTPPHLHFGISCPPGPRRAADDWKFRRGQIPPYPYLNLWKKGVAATPKLPSMHCPPARSN